MINLSPVERGRVLIGIILAIAVCIAVFLGVQINSCSRNTETAAADTLTAKEESPHNSKEDILKALQNGSNLVTTEVKVRKIAIYDTSKSEHFKWTNPSTWKYGERKCIIPVEVTLKYGYDLKELNINNVRISDNSTAVVIILPKAKIIDSGYNAYINPKEAVSIATGMRDVVGHEVEDEVMKKGYEEVLKQDFSKTLDKEIENNARILFTNILNSIGIKNVKVVTNYNEV